MIFSNYSCSGPQTARRFPGVYLKIKFSQHINSLIRKTEKIVGQGCGRSAAVGKIGRRQIKLIELGDIGGQSRFNGKGRKTVNFKNHKLIKNREPRFPEAA